MTHDLERAEAEFIAAWRKLDRLRTSMGQEPVLKAMAEAMLRAGALENLPASLNDRSDETDQNESERESNRETSLHRTTPL